MYNSQMLRAKLLHSVSNCFTVRSGVKQEVVLSPLRFVIRTDSILNKLEDLGVGCHMGGYLSGALANADDIYHIAISEYVWNK